MSEVDIDRLPRMKDYLKPEDLDTNGCLELAEEILRGMASALTQAARRAAADPCKENLHHLEVCRNVYLTDYFAALSGGLVNGKAAAEQIVKNALNGVKIKSKRRVIDVCGGD